MFRLSLEEGGVVTTCDISSLFCDDLDEVRLLLVIHQRLVTHNCDLRTKETVCSQHFGILQRNARLSCAQSRSGNPSKVTDWIPFVLQHLSALSQSELTDSHWAGSVQVEVCNAPAHMKVTCSLLSICCVKVRSAAFHWGNFGTERGQLSKVLPVTSFPEAWRAQ